MIQHCQPAVRVHAPGSPPLNHGDLAPLLLQVALVDADGIDPVVPAGAATTAATTAAAAAAVPPGLPEHVLAVLPDLHPPAVDGDARGEAPGRPTCTRWRGTGARCPPARP